MFTSPIYRFVALAGILLSAVALRAEEDSSTQLKALQSQLQTLAQQMASQQKTIEQQQKVITGLQSAQKPLGASPGAQIVGRLEDLGRKPSDDKTCPMPGMGGKGGSMDITIGAVVDTSFRFYNGPNNKAERPAGNDFNLRNAEVILTANVDKYFRSYAVLAATDDASNANAEAPVNIEEAAIETTSLDNVKVKGGRFFAPIGRLSSEHDPDLPFVTRPRSLDHFVGGEGQGDGVVATGTLPFAKEWKLMGGVFNKVGADYAERNGVNLDSNNPVTNRRSAAELTYFGKVLASLNAGKAHTFDFGVSTLQVPDRKIRRNLVDLEFTYHWHPPGSATKDRLIWGTELLRNQEAFRFNRDYSEPQLIVDDAGNPVDADGDGIPDSVDATRTVFKRRSRASFGGYSYLEYFYNKHWSFGPRFDFNRSSGEFTPGVSSEAFGTDGQPWLADDGTLQQYMKRTSTGGYEHTEGGFLTYKFTESSRLRMEYNYHQYFDRKAANEIYLQWTVSLGGGCECCK